MHTKTQKKNPSFVLRIAIRACSTYVGCLLPLIRCKDGLWVGSFQFGSVSQSFTQYVVVDLIDKLDFLLENVTDV